MANFDRRTLITGALTAAVLPRAALAAAAPAAPAAAPALPAALRFAIFRNNKPFGQYNVGIVTAGDTVTVTSNVAMAMKISGLTVFNYKLHCVEVWKDGKFAALESQSTRDSEQQTVSASRSALGININNKTGAHLLPSSANPLTHWNPAALLGGAAMFNPENGQLVSLKAQSMGKTPVILGNGSKVLATQWALRGEQSIDDWYDDAGVWTGLKGVLPDKSIIEYRRL